MVSFVFFISKQFLAHHVLSPLFQRSLTGITLIKFISISCCWCFHYTNIILLTVHKMWYEKPSIPCLKQLIAAFKHNSWRILFPSIRKISLNKDQQMNDTEELHTNFTFLFCSQTMPTEKAHKIRHKRVAINNKSVTH